MPYRIVRGSGAKPWKIKKGLLTVGSAKNKRDAEASVRAREASERKKKK